MENTKKTLFSEEIYKEFDEMIARFPEGKQKSAILPILHLAQENSDGWLPVPVMDHVAEYLDLLPVEVYEVATFYSMYNLKPVGKHIFEVCQTGPCMVCGSEKIIDHIRERLNIEPGETTEDGLFTLKPSECLGACGYAPMMRYGKTYTEHLTVEKIDEIIDKAKAQG